MDKDLPIQRRFTKIRREFEKAGVKLAWLEQEVKRSAADPHPTMAEFSEAFDALAPHVHKVYGHNAQQKNGFSCTGIDITFNKDGDRKVRLHGERSAKGFEGNLVFRVPAQDATGELLKCVEDLEYCATGYLNGEKGQLELPLESDEEAE
tara:strand:+ start:100 stop:549 length:450 start_codon:yes stop_codon:yes gene_type:complete